MTLGTLTRALINAKQLSQAARRFVQHPPEMGQARRISRGRDMFGYECLPQRGVLLRSHFKTNDVIVADQSTWSTCRSRALNRVKHSWAAVCSISDRACRRAPARIPCKHNQWFVISHRRSRAWSGRCRQAATSRSRVHVADRQSRLDSAPSLIVSSSAP